MTLEELTLEDLTPEVPAAELPAEAPEIEQAPAQVMTIEDIPMEEAAPEEMPVMESPVAEAAPVAQPEAPAEPVYAPPVQPVYAPPVQPVYAPPVQTAAAVAEAPRKHKRKKPHIALRMLLQLLSLVLSIVLFGTLIAGVLVADLRQITSEGGIKKLINALLIPTASAPVSVQPAPIEVDRMRMDDAALPSIPGDFGVDEDGNITIGGDVSVNLGDIPEDILTGGGGEANVMNLVDWIYDAVEESTENDMKFSKEEMQEFIQESTVADYVSEKLAGFTEDIINGTDETEITADELVDLLKENEDLMQEKLDIQLSREQWKEIKKTMDKVVEESQINETIKETVYEAVDNVLEENSEALGGLKREDIQEVLQTLTSDKLFFAFIGASLGLLLLLCLLNFYNVPAGLTWAAIPTILAGLIMAAPIYLLGNGTVLQDLLPAEASSVVGVLASFVNVFSVIHYGLLGIGVALLVISILWRIIRAIVRKSRA